MEQDLYIRRLYTHRGISVVVDIDLVKKTITLMESNPHNPKEFVRKSWLFADRELEYMGGWLSILEAMKHAIFEASKILEAQKERDEESFMRMIMSLSETLNPPKGKK